MAAAVAVLGGAGLLLDGFAGSAASPAGSSPEVLGEVPVTAMHQARGVAHNSPELAADPTARRFLASATRRDAPGFGCGLAVSGSAGQGWHPVDPVAKLPEEAKTCYAPEVSFGPDGRLHYLFAGLHGRGNEPMGVFLAFSDDRGRSFTEPQRVLGERNFSVRMSLDRSAGEAGRVYLAWLHATSDPPLGAMPPPPNPIEFAASPDGGETWGESVRLSPEGHRRVAAPAMRVAPDGTIYVAYYDLKQDQRDYKGLAGPVYEGTWSLVLARSTDGGDTFTTTVVEDAVRPVERVMLIFTMAPPALAASSDGRVCVGWPQAHEGHGDAVTRCSRDHGDSWSERTRINQDPGDSSAIHVLPQLAFAANGRLDAAYLARNPTTNIQHAYYAASEDDGQSFGDPVRVSSQPSSSRIGQRYVSKAAEGKVEFGSRLGLLTRTDHAVVMWPDTRNSRVGTTGQNLFAARVTQPGPKSSRGPAAALLGGGLVAVGLTSGGVGVVRRRRARQRQEAGQDSTEAGEGGADEEPDRPAAAGEGDVGAQAHPRRRWPRRAVLGAATAVAVAVVAGLGWGAVSEPSPKLPADPPEVTITLDGQGLHHDTPVPPGRVVFRVANRSAVEHRLTLLPMGQDEPPLVEQLGDEQPQVSVPFAGVAPLEPGQTTAFAVDLEAGRRYALGDFSADPEDPQGRSHAQQGWHSEFRTTTPTRPGPTEHRSP